MNNFKRFLLILIPMAILFMFIIKFEIVNKTEQWLGFILALPMCVFFIYLLGDWEDKQEKNNNEVNKK